MSNTSFDTLACCLSLTVALLVFILLAVGVIPTKILDAIERSVRGLAIKRALLMVLIPALSFVVNAAIAEKNGIPRARVQDEFGYLLAADTFAHGRLTNPTPEYWEHFETPHELMHPTYMSKYPPGQGMALALGQVLTGMPIIGVWLTTAAACAAIYWMLLGFISPPWAMLGGFVAAIHPLLLAWSQTYWGGSVALLGGAFVLGASVRLTDKPAIFPAFLLAIGLAILANSRPYEGLVFVAPLLLFLLWNVLRRRTLTAYLRRTAIPLLAILLMTAAFMAYYNYRVTGSPLRMPFVDYSDQYDLYPKFFFLPRHPQPIYRNDSMRIIHTVFERGDYRILRTVPGFFQIAFQRVWKLVEMHAHPCILLVPFASAAFGMRAKSMRRVWICVALFLVGIWAEDFFIPHYAAPVTPAVLLLIITGWSRLYQRASRGRPLGRFLAHSVAIGFFIGAVVSAAAPVDFDSTRVDQASLIDQAQSLQAGKHLIFVNYTPDHLMHDEWVYNQADIKNARIIWARYTGPAADASVARYYSGREIWLLTVGKNDLTLNVYSP
jgi:hypothetical protein